MKTTSDIYEFTITRDDLCDDDAITPIALLYGVPNDETFEISCEFWYELTTDPQSRDSPALHDENRTLIAVTCACTEISENLVRPILSTIHALMWARTIKPEEEL